MTTIKFNKEIQLINKLIPTINCKASSENEVRGAKVAIVKIFRKVMTNLGYDKNDVRNMHVCGKLRMIIEGECLGHMTDYETETTNKILSVCGIKN